MNDMHDEQIDIRNLLELAVLEAHGLLEPVETELFDRAFHDARQSVQDEIRRIQAEISQDDALLPSELPPPQLRQRVLDAVADAADAEAQRLAPLALIGARAGAREGAGRPLAATAWRAAALIMLGVGVVLAIFAMDANRRADRIAEYAMNADSEYTLAELGGAELASFLDNPSCSVMRLDRVDGSDKGYIRVAINERTGDSHVLAIDLAPDETLILQGTTPGGTVIELATITADGPVVARMFSIDPAIAATLVISAVDLDGVIRWS